MAIGLCALVVVLFCLFGLRYFQFGTMGRVETISGTGDHRTLVVYGPSLGGRTSRPHLEKLVRATFPDADILVPTYAHRLMSNVDAFDLTSQIELAIRQAYENNKTADGACKYEKIVLFGYSTGGLLLRKAYVWGLGFEDDRPVQHGRHPWVERLDRFVSLAAPNRGWPSDKPDNLDGIHFLYGYVMLRVARLAGVGRFIQNLMQGSPFVSNMRVQWIDLFRAGNALPGTARPLIVHLIGDKDELVDRSDSIDLEAGTGVDVVIKTLEGLSHADVGTLLFQDGDRLSPAGEAIRMALVTPAGAFPAYWADRVGALKTDPDVKHLIFVMHGIRDESMWPAEVKRSIEAQIGNEAAHVKIIPPLYRRFAMLPFLLYWDRQHNVRWFMDQYTQARAMYPNLEEMDFIGHSNGTYILASALQRYPVLKVRNVFFAGSVVPSHYNWAGLIAKGRVTGRVWNVCADFDWVVAILPQFFQQISDLLGIKEPAPGLLDIGSAGFHGFRLGVGTEGVLSNLKYIAGTHGAAFEPAMVGPIATYVSRDPAIDFVTAWQPESRPSPRGYLETASNLSWVFWTIGVGLIAGLGYLAFHLSWVVFAIYLVVLLGLLMTI